MSVFLSAIQFSDTILDFNAGFRVPHTLGSATGSALTPFPQPFPVDGVNYSVLSHTLQVESELSVTYATSVATLVGSGFTFDQAGAVNGGTAQGFALEENDVLSYAVAGCSIDGAAMGAALETADTADDRAVFASMFTGQDLILLSALKDRFDSGAGRDFIVDQGGSDRISAGSEDDIIQAQKGNDKVYGDDGNDLLFGGKGNDLLSGGKGRDFLMGEQDNDVLTGDKGIDFFVFDIHGGLDIVTDFVAADDQIIIRRGATSMADITITKVGADTVVAFADVIITLQNVARSTVSAADFIFGGNTMIDNAAAGFFVGWDYFA
jgi:Ca2+-binding RTX toxin-like protein